MTEQIYVGNTPWVAKDEEVHGAYMEINGKTFYKISNVNMMRPFFMSIVSPSDHWLFMSSNGGVTAGRRTPETALFPYETDDKITLNQKNTGGKAILKVRRNGRTTIWEPFSERYNGIYRLERNLYKSMEGSVVIFEEYNLDVELQVRSTWTTSDRFGFVRQIQVLNKGKEQVQIEFVDGIQNILPFGVSSHIQMTRSNLVDAYKKNELDTKTGIGIFSLSSMIVDRAEPSEALRASVVWSAGLETEHILLSSMQLEAFRRGKGLSNEELVRAEKGAYFIHATVDLEPDRSARWYIVADVNRSLADLTELRKVINETENLSALLDEDMEVNRTALRKKLGKADGLQLTNEQLSTGRHMSNVLYNIMRGGTFEDQYRIEKKDLLKYVKSVNKKVYKASKDDLETLGTAFSLQELNAFLSERNDIDLQRICSEFLPLSFSRRHGDPSRPWNHFTINVKDEHGREVKSYEGNWRDIFQNWEALSYSFPGYLQGMINRFLNASTIDGYNPYRITSDGIDWEVSDPNDPWSYIGYWGDHQIVYLLRLLTMFKEFAPGKLEEMLNKPAFVYANVPYKIRGYDAILMNPRETIDYDNSLAKKIQERVEDLGEDGKMSWDAEGNLVRANMCEKLLVTSLTKLYNFIPEAGIWLNTQRPEWNDANNALVGNGVSVITLCYLRKFLIFFSDLLDSSGLDELELNKPVSDLMDALSRGFSTREDLLSQGFNDEERRTLMDRFGIAGEHYRTSAYSGFLGNKQRVKIQDIKAFMHLALRFVDQSIGVNEREDGLFHSYNLLHLSPDKASISHLYEMLEGQVAILSSGYLNAAESKRVLDALRSSAMFRDDQYSYLLYPDRKLSSFLEKNKIVQQRLDDSALVRRLVDDGNKDLIRQGIDGAYHFNGDFHNANDVVRALNRLAASGYAEEVQAERSHILALFEELFNHEAFTGRSGTFYGYEGLGCIYWHMVSKLLVSIQEVIWSMDEDASEAVFGQLAEHYFEVRAGIGINKNPKVYGAFPTDPYSHTPKNKGAQQPGMTGQVKEDVLNRWAELGVRVENGRLSFKPRFLRVTEFLPEPKTFEYYGLDHEWKTIAVDAGAMAFTYCQVPVVYHKAETDAITLYMKNGEQRKIEGNALSVEESKHVFHRDKEIVRIDVKLAQRRILD